MKVARYFSLVVAAAFLFLAPVAQAQQTPKYLPGYFSLLGGIYAPEGTDLDSNNADTGFTGFLSFGHMMNPVVGFQTDIGYFETSGDNHLQVSAIPVVVSVKVGIPIAFIEPYFLGGGGVYFANTEFDMLDESSVEFGAHAAAGLNFNFGRLQLGAEARYIWLEASGLNVDGVLVMGKIGSRF